jgi:hypothetical protein
MPSRATQLQERANYCRRLAVGAADRKFAATLLALAAEYEVEVTRIEAQTEGTTALRKAEPALNANGMPAG